MKLFSQFLLALVVITITSCQDELAIPNSNYSWTKMTTPPSNEDIIDDRTTSFYFENGVFYRGRETNPWLFLSTDNAQTWSKAQNFTLPAFTWVVDIIKNGGKLICAAGDKIYMSQNGSLWTTTTIGYSINDLSAINDSTVIAATTRGVYKSSNNGLTWVNSNNGLLGQNSIPLVVNSLVWSGQKLFVSTSGGVYASSNLGNSWTSLNTGFTQGASTYPRFKVKSGGVYAVSYESSSYKLYEITNSASTWTQVNFTFPNGNLTDIESDGNNIYVLTQNANQNECWVFKSSNNGSSWVEIAKGSIYSGNDFGSPTPTKLLITGNKLIAYGPTNYFTDL